MDFRCPFNKQIGAGIYSIIVYYIYIWLSNCNTLHIYLLIMYIYCFWLALPFHLRCIVNLGHTLISLLLVAVFLGHSTFLYLRCFCLPLFLLTLSIYSGYYQFTQDTISYPAKLWLPIIIMIKSQNHMISTVVLSKLIVSWVKLILIMNKYNVFSHC